MTLKLCTKCRHCKELKYFEPKQWICLDCNNNIKPPKVDDMLFDLEYKLICECGSTYAPVNKYQHINTRKHKRLMTNTNNQ